MINVRDLEKLKVSFDKKEEEGCDGLDIDEFINVICRVIGENTDQKMYTQLFMKIDANSDGTVDWDEFTNFLLSENQGIDQMGKDSQADFVLTQMPLSAEQHRDMITAVITVDKNQMYYTGSRDGCVKLWDIATLQHKKTIRCGSSWINALTHLPASNRIVCATMDRMLNFFDLNGNLVSQVSNTPFHALDTRKNKRMEKDYMISTPYCLHSTVLPNKNELLSVGTDNGDIILYRLSPGWEVWVGSRRNMKHGSAVVSRMQADSVGKGWSPLVNACQASRLERVHSDWVTECEYEVDISSLISSSLDATIKFSDIDKRRRTRTYNGEKGIHSFAYCEEYKFVACGGLSRKVDIFDPHRCATHQSLTGHSAPLKKVLVNTADHQIISLSNDKVIKTWDFRTFKVLQTIHDENSYRPVNMITTMMFDTSNDRMITSTSKLHVWNKKITKKDTSCSHPGPLTRAIFNANFGQVVSGDSTGKVKVWDFETGAPVFRYTVDAKITSMSFDMSCRRLITGTDDGRILTWNFSSGQVLTECRENGCEQAHIMADANFDNKMKGAEVTGINYVMEASTWQNDQVVEFLENCRGGELKDFAQRFKDHNIKGRKFLKLTHEFLEKEMGISDELIRRTILTEMSSLFSSNTSYIVSVAWDRKVKIWTDGGDILKPSTVLESTKACGHDKNGINYICFCPPNLVATGGADGKICLWNIISGHFKGVLTFKKDTERESDLPVDNMGWLYEKECLVASGADSIVRFFDVRKLVLLRQRPSRHYKRGPITAMTADEQDTRLCTCSGPFIKVWDISKFDPKRWLEEDSEEETVMVELCHWRAHEKTIVDVNWVDERGMIISASLDRSVKLWARHPTDQTNDGFCLVGFFQDQQKKLWSVTDPKTWQEQEPRLVDTTDLDDQESSSVALDYYVSESRMEEDDNTFFFERGQASPALLNRLAEPVRYFKSEKKKQERPYQPTYNMVNIPKAQPFGYS